MDLKSILVSGMETFFSVAFFYFINNLTHLYLILRNRFRQITPHFFKFTEVKIVVKINKNE